MAEKNNDQTTPTGESPVYDSLVEPPLPEKAQPETVKNESANSDTGKRDDTVEATVEPEPAHTTPAAEEPLPEEPEEIVVADSQYVDEGHQTAVITETPVVEEKRGYAAPAPAAPQYVYVNNPAAPVKKGNRGFGVLVGFLSAVAFSLLFFIVMAIIYISYSGRLNLGFLAQPSFYVPTLFFLVGFIVLALLVNRGGWWLYIIGSLFVALFVYFGTVTTVLVINGLVLRTPDEAAELFRTGLSNPFMIAAALVSREVALWAGALVSRRGRRVKVRNSEALDEYMREREESRNS
jgi:hypothetical protein